MKAAIVMSKELDLRCWAPMRFLGVERCLKWGTCKYPEKKTCKAREAELTFEKRRLTQAKWNIRKLRMSIARLVREAE